MPQQTYYLYQLIIRKIASPNVIELRLNTYDSAHALHIMSEEIRNRDNMQICLRKTDVNMRVVYQLIEYGSGFEVSRQP